MCWRGFFFYTHGSSLICPSQSTHRLPTRSLPCASSSEPSDWQRWRNNQHHSSRTSRRNGKSLAIGDIAKKRLRRIDAAAFRVMRAIDRSSSGTTREDARRQRITQTPISAHKILYIVMETPCFVAFCALAGNISPTSVSRIQPATHRGSRRITTSQDRRCRVVGAEDDR